jgi:vancomycin resistance protein VanJ
MARKDENKAVSAPSGARRFFGFVWRAAWLVGAWIAAPVVLFGLALRLTVRDDFDPLALFFYATPWAVLFALSAICLIHWWRRARVRAVALAVSAGCLTMLVIRGFGFASAPGGPSSIRIAYWNVARPEWRLDKILRQADHMNADFLVFGEHREGPKTPAQWKDHYRGRFVLPLARELLLVAPDEVKRIDGGSLGGAGGCQICRAVVQGREIFLLMVDFTASLERSRKPAFDRLFQIVDAYSEKPLLVIGDFNTPSDSIYFDRLRSRLTSAFETAGRGYAATWPMPIPVLQLDHIWTNKHLRVIRCEHRTSVYSDHRAVIADVVFP